MSESKDDGQPKPTPPVFIGESAKAREILEFIDLAAKTEETVCLTGESGTGKDLVAKVIHLRTRGDYNFVKVNAASVPESLVEAELFGHAPNAFTDAGKKGKEGLVKVADNGTFFIDEAGNAPEFMQMKLLGLVEKEDFRPIGARKLEKVRTRFIFATNSNLAEMVNQGRFRRDLFYRLNVINFEVPPLRERRDDIPLLVQHFFMMKQDVKRSLTSAALELLKNHPWFGNIRELMNTISRLVVWSPEGEIGVEQVRRHLIHSGVSALVADKGEVGDEVKVGLQPGQQFSLNIRPGNFPKFSDIELELLRLAARRTGGNVRAAAKLASMGHQTFTNRMNDNPGFKAFVEALRKEKP